MDLWLIYLNLFAKVEKLRQDSEVDRNLFFPNEIFDQKQASIKIAQEKKIFRFFFNKFVLTNAIPFIRHPKQLLVAS